MKLTLTLLGALLVGNSALAQSQQEMNLLAAKDLATADAELNKIYQQVLEAQNDDEAKKLLKTAQKAWLAYRDAEADHAADETRGGSMAPLLSYATKTSLTEERTAKLKLKLGVEVPEVPLVMPEGGKTPQAACQGFFKAYQAHHKVNATAFATASAISKVNWNEQAATGTKESFEGEDTIRYDGGSMRLVTKQTTSGAWFVVDVVFTAD
jgi:uncharacterized protein YecT (DUF1311 family)